jgi:two-component system cell cycle sensor histidine kinase/response regulator CckA
MPIPNSHPLDSSGPPEAAAPAGAANPGAGFTPRNLATLKAIIDAVDSLVVVARIEGSLLLWNRRCEDSSGVPFAEVVGKPLWDVMRLRSGLRVEAQAGLDRLLSGQERRVSFISQWIRKDGRRARIAWTAEFVHASGDADFVVATGSETTRGKRATREFEETEARSETLLDLLPEAVVVHQDGRVVFANRVAASLYGYGDPSELLGLGVWDFVVPVQRDVIREQVAAILKIGGAIEPSRERHIRRDGTEFDVEVAAKPVVFGGRPAMEVIARDISERIAAERATAESEARMRAMFDDSAIGMILADRGGRSIESNAAFHRLLGYQQDELAKLSVDEYTHESDREATRRSLADLFDGRIDSYQLVKRYIRKDGNWVWARVNVGALRDSNGATSLAVVTIEDITASKELEERLRQASKMEALGRLAGGVAHDFNNLLTVVNGYADILVASLDGDERAAEATEIRRAGARGTELTAQLLAFGRRAPRSVERFDLNDRIGALVPLLRRLLGEDIEFQVELDHRIVFVETDPSQLDQVVMNLVVNARDAMPSGGELKLITGLLPAMPAVGTTGPDLTWARIEIVDTGYGMAPEVLERIFEPFFTTKNLGHGTGLGLATVYGIVEQMSGHIHVQSTLGVGSRFQVEIPLSTAVATATKATPPGSSDRGSETILLVEDEPAVRDFCKRALEAEGYRVVATGPKGAVEQATALGSSLDLLLSDVVMPEFDGPTIAAALTARRPSLPVLFMSGYPRDREGEIAGAAAAGAVLAKPFDARQLAEAVRRVLDRPGLRHLNARTGPGAAAGTEPG